MKTWDFIFHALMDFYFVIFRFCETQAKSLLNIKLKFFFAGTELGTVLTSVTANDVDTNPAITYSFMTSNQNNNSEIDDEDDIMSIFSIDRFSGKIILQKHLDYEMRQEYQLRILASDMAHVAETTLTVRVTDVNDNAPVFQQAAYHSSLPGKIECTFFFGKSVFLNFHYFSYRRNW